MNEKEFMPLPYKTFKYGHFTWEHFTKPLHRDKNVYENNDDDFFYNQITLHIVSIHTKA